MWVPKSGLKHLGPSISAKYSLKKEDVWDLLTFTSGADPKLVRGTFNWLRCYVVVVVDQAIMSVVGIGLQLTGIVILVLVRWKLGPPFTCSDGCN